MIYPRLCDECKRSFKSQPSFSRHFKTGHCVRLVKAPASRVTGPTGPTPPPRAADDDIVEFSKPYIIDDNFLQDAILETRDKTIMITVVLEMLRNPKNRNVRFYSKSCPVMQVFSGGQWSNESREDVIQTMLEILCRMITVKAESISFGDFYENEQAQHMSVHLDDINHPSKSITREYNKNMIEVALWTAHKNRV